MGLEVQGEQGSFGVSFAVGGGRGLFGGLEDSLRGSGPRVYSKGFRVQALARKVSLSFLKLRFPTQPLCF